MYLKYLKPLIDFMIALSSLLILLPVSILIMGILVFSGINNPFFLQERPGLNGKIFKIIKFRTMTDERDVDGKLLPDKNRLTYFGRIIRKVSLDEIPQLINVLKGDMSLVGPRPLLPEYLHQYNEEQARRHEVKPGITGWAQVNGRNTVKFSERFKYDVWYVNNLTLRLDVLILFLTVTKIFLSSDNIPGQETEDFDDLNFLN